MLPQSISTIDPNSLVVHPHSKISQLESMSDWTDIDIIIISRDYNIRIPCLFLQYEGKNSSQRKSMLQDENESKLAIDSDVTQVSKYLESLNSNKSIFEKLFGKRGLTAKTSNVESWNAQQLMNEKRKRRALLRKLNPVGKETSVIDDMFDGPVHTLPSLNSMFDQYMSYFVPRSMLCCTCCFTYEPVMYVTVCLFLRITLFFCCFLFLNRNWW